MHGDAADHTVAEFERFAAEEGRSAPFFAFLFFDSTHAPYDFPADHAPFRPYAEEINYAGLGLDDKRPLIVNRYRNAMHYLDALTAQLVEALIRNELLRTARLLPFMLIKR